MSTEAEEVIGSIGFEIFRDRKCKSYINISEAGVVDYADLIHGTGNLLAHVIANMCMAQPQETGAAELLEGALKMVEVEAKKLLPKIMDDMEFHDPEVVKENWK